MGLIMQIAAGRQVVPAMTGKDQAEVYRVAAERGYEALDNLDKFRMRQMMYGLGRNEKIRNFGMTGAKEVLMMIGILFASMSDEAFETMLAKRRAAMENEEEEE